MRRNVAELQRSASALGSTNFSALSADLNKIANPKFNWDTGLRQMDELTKRVQKGKLSISEYWETWRRGAGEMAQHQARLAQAFSTPLSNKGGMSMTIPSVTAINGAANATELMNRKLAVQSELLTGLGTKVQDWGKNTQWAGRQMMVGFTMPFAMAAMAAGKYALDIDKALVRIEKVYDGSTKGLREMAVNSAIDITRQLGATVQSSLEIMGELAAAGKQGAEMIELTRQAQRMSTLGDIEKADSIKAVISMQNIYKMSTQELSQAVDYLNAVDAATPTSLRDLADAIPIAGATVKQLGGDLKDTTVLLTAFRERGISTVEGANAIKSAMNRVLSPTKAAQKAFQEFTGQDINEVVKKAGSNPLDIMQALSDAIVGGNIALEDQQRIISKLFGTYQSARITGLLQGLQEDQGAVAKAKELSQKSEGELRSLAQKQEQAMMASASKQFTKAVEEFKIELKEFGDFAIRIATVVIQAFRDAFEFFNNLPGPIKAVAIGLGVVAAAAGPIVMLAGLFGNLFGSVIKFAGWLTGLKKGYKSMTIDQKAAELASGNMSKHMLSEAESAQILIFQMEKLVGAIRAVDVAQNKAAASYGPVGNMAGIKVGGQQVVEGAPGVYRTNTGRDLTNDEKSLVMQQLANREKEKTAELERAVATESEKTNRLAKAFNSETLIGVGAVAGMASMVADTGSGLEKWLTWISLGSVALSAILPILGKIATAVKGTSLIENLTGGGGAKGKIAGFAGRIGESLKGAFSSALSFMKTPMGIGLGVATIGVLGLVKLVSAEQEKQEKNHQDILRSTDDWTKALGRTKIEWGQIKNEAGAVQDTIASLAEKMKTDNAPMVERFRGVGNLDELKWMANTEVTRLQGQGLNQKEIRDSLEALLRAAGKKREEIEAILSNISVSFDFSNGSQDFTGFMDTIRKKVNALNADLFGNKSLDYTSEGEAYLTGASASNLQRQTEEIAQQFKDRIANMSDVDRAVFAKQFSDGMAEAYFRAFDELKSKYGDKIGANWREAREKFLSFDTETSEWKLNDLGKTELPADAGMALQNLAKQESDLAKSIAKANGASDEQLKSISVMADVMPFMTQGVKDSTKVQDSYNKAIKDAEAGGRRLTQEEKLKIAQLYASVSGLDAAKIASNGYAAALQNTAEKAAENGRALQSFVGSLKDAANAGNEMWNEFADPANGFASLGGTVEQQASMLTDKVKGIYSGTMDDVYDAYASSAQEIWQQRLDNISKSFERKKEAMQKQIEDFDKAYEQKQQAFNDRWDELMDNTRESFDDRREAIEDEAEAQINAIDDQIEALQAQQEQEQELEEQRQRQFEAEKQRIERMAELANRRIDYNRALFGGDLDEAARVQNNTESLTIGWSIDDQNQAAEDKANEKAKLTDKQIKELEGTKELVNQQKQAKLDALKEEEEATMKSLEKQREAERRSMEVARDIERQRLQNRLDSLQKEQQAAEEKERKVQEFQRRTMEQELATLKMFIPQNEQQLNEHINRVGGAYGEFGLGLQGAGSMWGQIVGNALQNNVDQARMQMSSDANWSAFGAQVAGAISQGAFGLNLNDFMNLLKTGQPPSGWTPPTGGGYSGNGIAGGRHQGGPIDGTPGSRNGRGNSPIGSDEQVIVAQKGEFMINKAAVQKIGTQHLERINAGQPMNINPGVNFAGMAGGFASIMGRAMTNLAVNRLAEHYAAQNADIAAALGFTTGSGTGAAVEFAKAQDGKPYIWGGVGPAGYDCSGYMSAIANVLTGKDPHKRLFSTGMVQNGKAFGPFVPGLGGKFQIGVSNGHTAGTLMGTNVESTGNHVRYGKDAKGATDKQFHLRFHVPDDKVVEGAANWGPGDPGGKGVERWRPTVSKALSIMGLTQSWTNSTLRRMDQESGGNPTIVNLWDSNAKKGTPSVGLMQVIGPTYASNKHPQYDVGPYSYGTSVNPLANILASMKYAMKRYGSLPAAYDKKGGYDFGGDVYPGDTLVQNRTREIETIVTANTRDDILQALKNATVTYGGFKDVLKQSVLPNVAAGIDTPQGNTYNYDISVNGSGLNPKELKRVMVETIEEVHIKDKKKRGEIK